MPVHPLIAARFPLISQISSLEESLYSPEAAQMKVAYEAPYASYSIPDVAIEATSIPGPHGDIPVRAYRPSAASRAAPGLLWMHGGAFVAGDLEMPEAHVVSAELASRGAIVVSVDYRLATATVRYPVPLDDHPPGGQPQVDVVEDRCGRPRICERDVLQPDALHDALGDRQVGLLGDGGRVVLQPGEAS